MLMDHRNCVIYNSLNTQNHLSDWFDNPDFLKQPQFMLQSGSIRSLDEAEAIIIFLEEASLKFKQIPCHQIFSFQVKTIIPCSELMKIGAGQIRQSLCQVLQHHIQWYRLFVQQNRKQKSINNSLVETLSKLSKNDLKKILRKQLQQILIELTEYLKGKQNSKQIYQNIVIQWKQNCIDHLMEEYKIQNQLLKYEDNKHTDSLGLMDIQSQNTKGLSSFQNISKIISTMKANQCQQDYVLSSFSSYYQQINHQQSQPQTWRKCSESMKQIILSQMDTISLQKEQIFNLKEEIKQLRSQYAVIELKCNDLQGEALRLAKQFEEMQKVSQFQPQESYYISPNYQRNEYEQKLLVEMIQLQSDLFLSKSELSKMTSAIYQIFKVVHKSFDNLDVSNDLISSVNRSLMSIAKDLKSFANANFEHIFAIKEEPSAEHDYLKQLRKSTNTAFTETDQRFISFPDRQLEEDLSSCFRDEL